MRAVTGLLVLLAPACGSITIGSAEGGAGGVASDAGASGSDTGGSGGMAVAGRPTFGGAAGSATGGMAVGGETGGNAVGGSSDVGGAGGASPTCTLRITGEVTTPLGSPLPDVRVTLSGDTSAVFETGDDGRYVFEKLCPGAYTVAPASSDWSFCPESAPTFELDRDAIEDFSGSPEGCEPALLERRVAVLVYDPRIEANGFSARLSRWQGWEDPVTLVHRYARALTSMSNGHVSYDVGEPRVLDAFPPPRVGDRYDAASYAACADDATRCYDPNGADLAGIATEERLCELVESGAADDVWLVGGENFGFSTVQVQTLSCPREADAVSREADVVSFDVSEGQAGMLARLHRRSETVLSRIFPTVITTVFDDYVGVAGSAGASIAGCGTWEAAPNAIAGHPFDSPAQVQSICDAYFSFPFEPAPVATHVDCSAWSCTEHGFRRYWFRHLPRARGLAPDGHLYDWWRYLVRPEDRRRPPDVSCSTSYRDDWCGRVVDRDLETDRACNVGEWATAGRPTGWVEFLWAVARPVERVQLYDRACEENVVRGHLEFSDGSDPIKFQALEDSGVEATTLTFDPPKLLTGLRVFIDESVNGPNPGFREIVVE